MIFPQLIPSELSWTLKQIIVLSYLLKSQYKSLEHRPFVKQFTLSIVPQLLQNVIRICDNCGNKKANQQSNNFQIGVRK